MDAWIETIGVGLLALAGFFAGRWFSRLPKPYWTIGYFIPLLLICSIGLARRHSALELVPPFSWLLAGRTEFALGALVTTMILTTPLTRLVRARDRRMVMGLMILIVWLTAIWPFLAPAFNRGHLASLKTNFDEDGVCRQSNEYNCGPAAAVTALRQLGLPAEEGQIAILAHTSTAIGTPPDLLCAALQTHYRTNGLICEYRHFKAVSELKGMVPTLAVIKFAFLVDHYVTVLEVGEQTITVGDPFLGKRTFTHDEFAARWRFLGVTLKKSAETK